jgi:putative peptide zinc metalloprotease protein
VTDTAAEAPPRVGPDARVALHELSVRRDRDEWIVGRMATRTFVALPPAGARAVRLLGEGLSVARTQERLRADTGEEFDIADFVTDLAALGFVARIDGRPLPDPAPPRASLPWLRPRHVRFALHPVLPVAVAVLLTAALVTMLLRPGLLPGYRDLLWSPHGSVVLLSGAAAGWTLLLAHELAHLVTARAAGVPGRMRLGTRLQFLVMQTDISGIELAPRRHRLTAYLSGIALNLSVASALVPVLAATDPASTAHRLSAAALLLALMPLPFQLMVFTRTDVYFVLQDLTGCRDLYGDGLAYARYRCRRLLRSRAHKGEDDPSARLPRHERRAVRVYSVVLVMGTAACLAFMAAVTLPLDIALLARAVRGLAPGNTPAGYADSAAVLVTLGGVNVLWLVTKWRDHRSRRRAKAVARART